MERNPPTDRQVDALIAIETLLGEHGIPPSMREVAVILGVTTTAARERILGLIRKGLLDRPRANIPRGIIITKEGRELLKETADG